MQLTTSHIARGLTSTFPELGDIDSVAILGDGYHSLVVETQGEVFKIAKNWHGGAVYAKERHLLPLIRDHLPVPVPYPVWSAGPSAHFPFGVLGYPLLAGRVLADQPTHNGLAAEVARFILALHRIQITPSVSSNVPQPRAHWDAADLLHDTLAPTLREMFSAPDYTVIKRWWHAFLSDANMHRYSPVLQHGDLWQDNMLVHMPTGRLCGIVDFENAAIGDPAQDFATLLHLGRPFVFSVLQEYEAAGGILDEALLYRAQRLWELRGFIDIGFAIREMNQDAFDDAALRLRNGPLFNDTTRRETSLWPPLQQ